MEVLVHEVEYLRRGNEEQKGIIENLNEQATKMAWTCEVVVLDN